ncbi:hypothetical protein Nepgr_006003 [Nepenthes gracilis]|uniref:Uncharacterized protein n=1 Tax=Nepenthes gracilis TaxID=150966 RepID=A0AAD3S4L5_NEPGR|nr:hypothetical protein Nepgr_006003 [Nepenthes gracilis]
MKDPRLKVPAQGRGLAEGLSGNGPPKTKHVPRDTAAALLVMGKLGIRPGQDTVSASEILRASRDKASALVLSISRTPPLETGRFHHQAHERAISPQARPPASLSRKNQECLSTIVNGDEE